MQEQPYSSINYLTVFAINGKAEVTRGGWALESGQRKAETAAQLRQARDRPNLIWDISLRRSAKRCNVLLCLEASDSDAETGAFGF
ncbi:hypothetical protein D9754_02150 [Planomicrobium sp. Y74]|nr:hypothetical protein D9754_02150 [Planomicrobium sp. Y74]